jgi:hypothetical protein
MSPKQKQLNVRIDVKLEKEVERVTELYNKYFTIKASKSSIIEAAIGYGLEKVESDALRMDELYFVKKEFKDMMSTEFVLTPIGEHYRGTNMTQAEVLSKDERAIEVLSKLENCNDKADQEVIESTIKCIGPWDLKTDDPELLKALNGCSYAYLVYLIKTRFLEKE